MSSESKETKQNPARKLNSFLSAILHCTLMLQKTTVKRNYTDHTQGSVTQKHKNKNKNIKHKNIKLIHVAF